MACGKFTFNRTWERVDNSCAASNGFSQKDLDMRRKAEILLYNKNTTGKKLTKKQHYAQLAKGNGPNSRQSFKNVTQCPPSSGIVYTPASASGVPGNELLYMDKSVPLTRYVVRRTYN